MINQRTSGPVNAHLTTGPGIYFNYFIHVYSPIAGTDNTLGTKFLCQQKFLITLSICSQFKKKFFEAWFFTVFLCVFFPHVYSPKQGQTTHCYINFMTTERPFLFAHMLQVSKWSFWNLILYTFLMILYMYMALGQGQKPPGDKLLMPTESPYHFDHLLQVSNKSLWILILYTFFNVCPHVYSPVAGADNPLRTKFWCQQKGLVTLPICCKFQKSIFEMIFYIFLPVFIHVHSSRTGADNPLGSEFLF